MMGINKVLTFKLPVNVFNSVHCSDRILYLYAVVVTVSGLL